MKVLLSDTPVRDKFMISVGFGKRQGFGDKTADTLTKGAMPAFLAAVCLSFQANTTMSAVSEDRLVNHSEFGVGAAISKRKRTPSDVSATARLSTTILRDSYGRPMPTHIPRHHRTVWAANFRPSLASLVPTPEPTSSLSGKHK